jgi:WD40 repeat protein
VVATENGLNFHAPASRNLAFTKLPDTSLNTLAFSHNGKMLAVGGEQAFLLDASTWEARKIPLDTEFYGEVIALAFSPDDQFLAISTGPRILLFETPTGNQVQEFKKLDGPSARYEKLLFSPDGKTLVSASGSSELKSVRLWEIATAELRHDFGESSFDIGEILVFSEDGKFLNTSGRTWD